MVDLDGLDIAPRLARYRRRLCDDALAVLHGNAHLEKLLGARHPCGGKGSAGFGGMAQKRGHGLAVPRFERLGELPDDIAYLGEAPAQCGGVVECDAAPQLRRTGGDARRILEAARRKAEQRLLVVGVPARKLDERRGDDVRYVAYHGDRFVVILARKRDHACTDARDDLVQKLEMLRRRILVGAEDPVGPFEKVGARTFDAVDLGTGHGVARHEVMGMGKKLAGRRKDVGLGRCRIRDNASIVPCRQPLEVLVDRSNGRGDDDDLASPFDELLERGIAWFGRSRDPSPLERRSVRFRGDVDAEHFRFGALGAVGGRKRGSHKAEAHNCNPGNACGHACCSTP